MSDRPVLLDTHAALWLARGELVAEAAALLDDAAALEVPVLISPITAWELGMLVARRRVAIPSAPVLWLNELIGAGALWAPLTPQVLADASFLPGQIHRDPADRILAATARAFGYRLMTRDRALLAYAEAGHLQAVAC
ncbi:MAG TPA: type II toxin-antitoxin system VapC family toxin [Caulobacteraceae bacterium]